MDAVFQKLLSGHKISDAWMHARTGVTLNAPPPFLEWRGIKSYICFPSHIEVTDLEGRLSYARDVPIASSGIRSSRSVYRYFKNAL